MVAVEMGRRYFPRCSKALDKFMEDDLPDLLYLEKGTPEEQRMKKQLKEYGMLYVLYYYENVIYKLLNR